MADSANSRPVPLNELTQQQRANIEHAISRTLDKIAGAWSKLRTEQYAFESGIEELTQLTPDPVDALRHGNASHFMDETTREAIIEASGLLGSADA